MLSEILFCLRTFRAAPIALSYSNFVIGERMWAWQSALMQPQGMWWLK